MKEFVSLKKEKSNFSVIMATVPTRKKSFVKNLNLIDWNYHCKNWIDWISAGWDKISQPQKCKLLEGAKDKNITILLFREPSTILLLEYNFVEPQGWLSQFWKLEMSEKNGLKVWQNSTLYVFCCKMCNPLELRDHEGRKWSLWNKL